MVDVAAEEGIANVECTSKWKTKGGQLVRCGVCMSCRITRTEEWAMRIEHECHGKDGCFITLTYRDDPVTLCKRDLQLFFKRLRRRIDVPIKYYACGEYGDLNNRPHYHSIIIGWRPMDLLKAGKYFKSTLLEELWPYGFNTVGSIDPQSIRYVTGYIRKKLYGDAASKYGERLPPFSLMSVGIGKKYALDNAERLSKNLMQTRNGKTVGLPRYYKTLYDRDGTEVTSRVRWSTKLSRVKKIKEYLDDDKTYSNFVEDEQSDLSRRRRHIDARSTLTKKGRL